MISSKKGKLYFKFLLSTVFIAAAVYSYSALAAVPSSSPAVVNSNATTINGVPIAKRVEIRVEVVL